MERLFKQLITGFKLLNKEKRSRLLEQQQKILDTLGESLPGQHVNVNHHSNGDPQEGGKRNPHHHGPSSQAQPQILTRTPSVSKAVELPEEGAVIKSRSARAAVPADTSQGVRSIVCLIQRELYSIEGQVPEFQLYRIFGLDQRLSVAYSTAKDRGRAVAGKHYVATEGVVTFEKGQNLASFNIEVVDDDGWEVRQCVCSAHCYPMHAVALTQHHCIPCSGCAAAMPIVLARA